MSLPPRSYHASAGLVFWGHFPCRDEDESRNGAACLPSELCPTARRDFCQSLESFTQTETQGKNPNLTQPNRHHQVQIGEDTRRCLCVRLELRRPAGPLPMPRRWPPPSPQLCLAPRLLPALGHGAGMPASRDLPQLAHAAPLIRDLASEC